MNNTHCIDCKNKTKLLLRDGKERYYICKFAKACPYTLTKSESGRKL